MQAIPDGDLSGVIGGLTIAEAGKNAVGNVQQWGRAVYGRGALAAGFARDAKLPVNTYSKQLESYDLHYKPIIPNHW
jgi:hypothetical protein